MPNPHLILLHLLLISLFLLHCSVIGFAVNHALKLWQHSEGIKNNRYLHWFFAMSCGLMLNITTLFILGIMGWFYRTAILWSGLASCLLAVFSLLRTLSYRDFITLFQFRLQALFELLVFILLFLLLMLKAVKVPGDWDDTSFHLPMARFYIENHGIVLNQYLRFPLFPQNINLLLALGLMLGHEVVAQGLATLPLLISCIGLLGATIWMLNSTCAGYLAIAMLLMLRPSRSIIGYAYIDHGLALFCWGALLALAMWNQTNRQSRKWVVMAGLLAGGAAGSKYFGAVLATLIGLYLIIICKAWRAALIYAVTVTLLGSGWYLRSLLIAGDPIHPAGATVFGYFLWDAQDLITQKEEQASFGVATHLLYLIPAMIKAHVSPWICALFAGCFFKKESRSVRFLYIIFLSYFLFWFYVTQVPRYLAPLFAVGCFLTSYTVCQGVRQCLLRTRLAKRAGLQSPYLPSIICLLLLLPFCLMTYQKAVKTVKNWDHSLEAYPGYTLFQQANQLIPVFGPRVVQIGFEKNIYFFNGTTIGDCFGIGRYRNMQDPQLPDQLIPAQEMLRYLQQFDSRMLIVRNHVRMDLMAYTLYFDIQKETEDGLLLTIKSH